MLMKNSGRVALALATLGLLAQPVLADEIVHFTNGAEMPVRAHTVDKEKSMVKLDLGANSFISFPMSMVEKIVSAGQDVFLNPGFHPSNQAIAGISGGTPVDTTVHGTSAPVGFVRQPDGKGHAGVMLGEAADAIPAGAMGGPQLDNTVANSRKRFNPAFPPVPGGPPQVIMPPSMAKTPVQFQMNSAPPAQPPTPTPPPPQPPAAGAQDTPPDPPPADDPPDNR
jgi:hypothetical protein